MSAVRPERFRFSGVPSKCNFRRCDVYAGNSQFGGQDRLRVNLLDRYELEYWTMRFRVTTEQLIGAVEEVGPMAVDVGDKLAN